MLQLYEGKYKEEVQKFGGEQIGRRRRDDYTDGTVRLAVQEVKTIRIKIWHQHLQHSV